MSTRKRSKRDRTTSKSSHEAPSTSPAKEKEQPGALSDSPGHVTQSNLPPSRPRKEILRSVSPPGLMVPLRYFIYTLVTIALLSAGWYTYITAVGLKHWKEEVGWWGVTVGRIGRKQDKFQRRGQEVKGELEWHLSQLASALGIPATDVASALKPFVPPATLSSLAPRATGEAMKVLFEESHQKVGGGGAMGSVAEGLGTVVGFDDPLEGGS